MAQKVNELSREKVMTAVEAVHFKLRRETKPPPSLLRMEKGGTRAKFAKEILSGSCAVSTQPEALSRVLEDIFKGGMATKEQRESLLMAIALSPEFHDALAGALAGIKSRAKICEQTLWEDLTSLEFLLGNVIPRELVTASSTRNSEPARTRKPKTIRQRIISTLDALCEIEGLTPHFDS